MTFGFAKRLDLQTYEAMYAVLFLPGYVTLLRPSPGPRHRVELTIHRYVYRLLRETGDWLSGLPICNWVNCLKPVT